MASVSFTATCLAFYRTHLNIPEDLAKEGDYAKIAKYCREHISEAEIEEELHWLEDPEYCVEEDDIRNIYID